MITYKLVLVVLGIPFAFYILGILCRNYLIKDEGLLLRKRLVAAIPLSLITIYLAIPGMENATQNVISMDLGAADYLTNPDETKKLFSFLKEAIFILFSCVVSGFFVDEALASFIKRNKNLSSIFGKPNIT